MADVITVFRSRLRADVPGEYFDLAEEMLERAKEIDGFVEHKVFVAEDGERLTLVTFASDAAESRWREHAGHRDAQRRGRDDFYDEYDVTVADVRRRRRWCRQA